MFQLSFAGVCNECSEVISRLFKFCPYCGAGGACGFVCTSEQNIDMLLMLIIVILLRNERTLFYAAACDNPSGADAPATIDPVVECLPAPGGARSDLVNNLVSTSAGTVSVIEVLLFKMQHRC
jgi:RNA polymerase subunit RPABC4/transcription elongation factor Spt4